MPAPTATSRGRRSAWTLGSWWSRTARDLERLGQLRLRSVARVDVDLTGLADLPPAVVGEAPVALVEGERDGLLLTGCERHALEAAQPPHRLGEARHRIVDVELDDLVALGPGDVLHVDRGPHAPVARHPPRAQAQVRDLELAVAEPVTEHVLRVAAVDVAVARVVLRARVARVTRVLVVVVDRHLADAARERDRQLAAGVDVAEHHVGDRVASLHAGEPRLEDRRGVIPEPAQRERGALEQA